MEIASLVFGVGGIFQAFESCFKAIHLITSTRQVGSDASLIQSRVVIEQTRLLVWGRRHRLVLDHSAQRPENWSPSELLQVPLIEQAAEEALLGIRINSQRLVKLLKTHKIDCLEGVDVDVMEMDWDAGTPLDADLTRANTAPATPAAKGYIDFPKILQRRQTSIAEFQRKTSWTKRLRFGAGDRDALEKCLFLFKYFNDSLDKLETSGAILASAAKGAIICSHLPHQTGEADSPDDADQLSLELQEYQTVCADDYTDVENFLQVEDQIRRKGAELDTQERFVLTKEMPYYKVKYDALNVGSSSSKDLRKRCFGTLEDGATSTPILIEFKTHDPQLSPSNVTDIMKRIDNLCHFLITSSSAGMPLIPRALGFFQEPTPLTSISRIGLVYPLPSPSLSDITTLHQILPKPPPHLNVRFDLALSLATALHHIHVSGWYHKAVRSNNILFLSSPPDLSSPVLTGFEYSRRAHPDDPASQKEYTESTAPTAKSRAAAELYTHPDQLAGQGFRWEFEAYAFACVMLEIGMWRALEELKDSVKGRTDKWRRIWIAWAVSKLPARMGRMYAEVVEKLLKGQVRERKEFWWEVVEVLGRCRV